MIENKRGQGLSTNAIILIVLGVIVLVILAIGFIAGWDRIAPWIKTNNVDAIAQSCETACATSSTYEFCSFDRKLNDGKGDPMETTCFIFANEPDLKPKYGIKPCEALDCKKKCGELIINGEPGDSTKTEGKYDVTSFANGLGVGKNCFIGEKK